MKSDFKALFAIGVAALGLAGNASASLLGRWDFDEKGGTTAFNSVVGGVDGSLVGGAAFTITGGIAGGAIQIDSYNGFVTMGDNFPATPTFSLQAWVKTAPNVTTAMTPISKHISGIGQGYYLSINSVNDGYTFSSQAGFRSMNGNDLTATGLPAVNDGFWHQLVGVFDKGTSSLYVDGQLAARTFNNGYSNNAANFIVGGLGGVGSFYNGLVDEVRVYDSALSGVDVAYLYSNVTAVPEPETYATLMAGIGLLGAVARRRKNKQA